jgi:trehalose 6-phosphate phosphatase
MAAALSENIDDVVAQLRLAAQVALFLDFDGTLSPFAGHPDQAQMSPGVRQLLQRLASMPKVLVGIISGRELEDVRKRVGLPELIYAGNHGLEIRGLELKYLQPAAEAVRGALQRMSIELRSRLRTVSGVLVENKGLTASIHYRMVADRDREYVRSVVDAVVVSQAEPFVRTDGHLVFEVRPQVEWHKGNAVRWILERLAVAGSRAVYIGDDRTDEDAFAALPTEITIKVGFSTATHARYQVSGCDDVALFLQRLLDDIESNQAAR